MKHLKAHPAEIIGSVNFWAINYLLDNLIWYNHTLQLAWQSPVSQPNALLKQTESSLGSG